MSVDSQVTTLSAAFDDYPHTQPLKRGEIQSPRIAFAFSDIKPANRFFKPMVRELKFDVSEMAIATYVQAKAYGKPLVLVPATMMGRFQQGTILCSAARPLTPAGLAGKRSASAPTARPPQCGCAASFRTTTAWISIGYGGSRSKMAMWPNITSRRALNGPQRQEPSQDAARGRARRRDLWRRPSQ